MTSWNDDRLDKRDEELKEGFARLERQMADGFAESNERFAKVDERFAKVDERLAGMATRQEMNENVAKLEAQIRTSVAESNRRFIKVECQIEDGFAEMRSAYATLTRTLLVGAVGIIAALIGVVGALLA